MRHGLSPPVCASVIALLGAFSFCLSCFLNRAGSIESSHCSKVAHAFPRLSPVRLSESRIIQRSCETLLPAQDWLGGLGLKLRAAILARID